MPPGHSTRQTARQIRPATPGPPEFIENPQFHRSVCESIMVAKKQHEQNLRIRFSGI
jgi:hypothetical protein